LSGNVLGQWEGVEGLTGILTVALGDDTGIQTKTKERCEYQTLRFNGTRRGGVSRDAYTCDERRRDQGKYQGRTADILRYASAVVGHDGKRSRMKELMKGESWAERIAIMMALSPQMMGTAGRSRREVLLRMYGG
jgi:hypothetical protein